MRKTLFVIAGMGLVGMVILSILMNHYLGVNPRVRAVLDLRALCDETPGVPQRVVRLFWKLPAKEGERSTVVRAIFRPLHGPNAPTQARQAQELGEFLLKNWPARPEAPRPEWVEIHGVTDGPDQWQKVTHRPAWAPPGTPEPVAPPKGSGYSPPPPAPAPSPAPGKSSQETQPKKQS